MIALFKIGSVKLPFAQQEIGACHYRNVLRVSSVADLPF
jgi:hypothetical protein